MDSTIATLLGVVLGGGISFIATYLKMQQDDKLDKRKILIARLEEAHECLGKVKEAANLLNVSAMGKLALKVDYQNLLQEKVPMERLSMLISFYTPSLAEYLKPIEISHVKLAGEICQIIMVLNPTDKERGDYIVRCMVLAKEITDNGAILQKKLAEHCQTILGQAK